MMRVEQFATDLAEAIERKFARALAPTIVQVDAVECEDGATIMLWGYDADGHTYTADAAGVTWHRQGH